MVKVFLFLGLVKVVVWLIVLHQLHFVLSRALHPFGVRLSGVSPTNLERTSLSSRLFGRRQATKGGC